jgi:hypothetical protein
MSQICKSHKAGDDFDALYVDIGVH